MHTEQVEIYSDETNLAVMRHPGRKFPGVLLQGDTLHALCDSADSACDAVRRAVGNAGMQELNDLRNQLQSLLSHYKAVLDEHKIRLPFSETPAK
jgi:hypothetical protein